MAAKGGAVARAHLALLHFYRRMPRWLRLFVVHQITPSYTVGAICVIERDDGAVLLVRHSYRRRWGFPGGLVGRGEEVVDAACREAREEVRLTVEVSGEPAVVVDPDPRRVDVVFRARALDADKAAAASPEIVECRWFALDDLPELQHEAASALVALARVRGEQAG